MSDKRKKKEAKRAARKDAARKKRESRVHRDAQGRAHLVVHRDGLSLSQPLFGERWQNEVALATATTANGRFAEGRTSESAVALAREAMDGASKIAEAALALSPDRPPACRAGCAHCCYQSVGVTAPEALAIYAHLRDTLAPDALEATLRRVREADDRTRGLTAAERISPDLPCPFLEDARCSIYEVRPLSCRGANSLDAEACARPLRDPEARAGFIDGTLGVPCYLEPIRAFHAVTAGLQLALAELHGLKMLPLELTAAVRVLADDPEGVPREWLAGADPFAAARGGDNTADPRIAELAGRRVPTP